VLKIVTWKPGLWIEFCYKVFLLLAVYLIAYDV
jgi:hypothetical protein